jgi:glucose/mannose-6-phosphate isomerase
VVVLPSGYPPRAALAYSVIAQAGVLECFGLIGSAFRDETAAAADLIESRQHSMMEEATVLAEQLASKITVIYSDRDLEPVSLRFRQQLEENSKQLAWHHALPEMNHNELVGWRNVHNIPVVFLRWGYEHERTALRIDFTKELIGKKAGFVGELRAAGDSRIAQSWYLVHMVDWVSQLAGEILGVDTMEVSEIEDLKLHLSKVKSEVL